MKRSESIAKLAEAKAKAQAKIQNATKAAENPGFARGGKPSKYADLGAIVDACKDALAENGIAYFQSPSTELTEKGIRVTVTTLLSHSSGEWIESEITAPAGQATPQAIGSAVTYLRRYALAAMTGVAPEDDDGNAASGVDAAAGRPETSQPTPSRSDSVKAKVAAQAAKPTPIDAYKSSALKEATILCGGEEAAKAWLRGIRQDPQGKREWTEADVEKVDAAMVLLKAKTANAQRGLLPAEEMSQ